MLCERANMASICNCINDGSGTIERQHHVHEHYFWLAVVAVVAVQ